MRPQRILADVFQVVDELSVDYPLAAHEDDEPLALGREVLFGHVTGPWDTWPCECGVHFDLTG